MALIILYSGFTLEKAILTLSGASDISELAEEEFERYSHLAAHPLKLNSCTRSALIGCGILSSYQVETLLDYRHRHGDILSVTELSVVNGFAGEIAQALSPFVDFSPGIGTDNGKLRIDAMEAITGGGVKVNEGEPNGQWRARSNFEALGGRYGFGAAIGTKSPWSGKLSPPDGIGWNVHANAGKWLTEAVVGCFNLRFGQGLLMWSGSVFNSYDNPASLMKRPSGIVPYKGWSPSYAMKGIGARMDFGHFSISPFATLGNKDNTMEYGGNVSWNHANGEIGATVRISDESRGYSLDFQQTVRGTVLYGEACITGKSPSVLFGATVPYGNFNTGLRVLWSDKEHNVTSALSYVSPSRKHSVNSGITASYAPDRKTLGIKAQCHYSASLSDRTSLATRGTVSLKDKRKYSLRQELSWDNGVLSAGVRADAAYCISIALMTCADFGYKAQAGTVKLSADIQAGAFLVDNWDDRIYVYMKDLPGSFSVPALYGRGWWVNTYAKVTTAHRLSACLRVMYSAYPWAREVDLHKKPALNAGLQLSWKLF